MLLRMTCKPFQAIIRTWQEITPCLAPPMHKEDKFLSASPYGASASTVPARCTLYPQIPPKIDFWGRIQCKFLQISDLLALFQVAKVGYLQLLAVFDPVTGAKVSIQAPSVDVL